MASIPRFAIVTLLLVVGSPAMVYGLTTFVDHDFVDADPNTRYNHWDGWDPASGRNWTFSGPRGTGDCAPQWNPGKGFLVGQETQWTWARLNFGATQRVDPTQHEKVHVQWAWRLLDADEKAEFTLWSQGDIFLKAEMATNDVFPDSTSDMILRYGEGENDVFTLVENVQPGQFYKVNMELDMRSDLRGRILSASASLLTQDPDNPEILYTLQNMPIGYAPDVPGFDTLRADYLGAGSSHSEWDVFKVQEVPEPASLALLAFGGLALVRRRRKA